MQDQLKQAVKTAGEREQLLEKEVGMLRESNAKLMGFGELREKALQEELQLIKGELKNIQTIQAQRELQYLKEREVLQKEL